MNNFEVLMEMVKKDYDEALANYKASGDQYDLGVLMTYGSVLNYGKILKGIDGEEA